MSLYYKMMRRGGEEIEYEAVLYCKDRPWSIPKLNANSNVVVSASGREVYSLMKTCTAAENAMLVLAMFEVMAKLHQDDCLHLDFHPRNFILCDILTPGCTMVTLGKVDLGCYLIDFETIWFPTQTVAYFNDLSEKWNSLSDTGLGRMPHGQYSTKKSWCYDVYSLATYTLLYLRNAKGVSEMEPALREIAGLAPDEDVPGVTTVDSAGEEETYYTYLTDPDRAAKVLPVQDALKKLRFLRKSVDAFSN